MFAGHTAQLTAMATCSVEVAISAVRRDKMSQPCMSRMVLVPDGASSTIWTLGEVQPFIPNFTFRIQIR